MKLGAKTGLAAVVLGLTAAAWWQRSCGGAEQTVWLRSFEWGQQVARRSGKPLFVVFRCER